MFSSLEQNIPWLIAAAIVVLGLLVYGFFDLTRFSFRRTWAISGVCFDESIRRRVLWITPLAILGAIVVTQLSAPLDAQDAVRQTIKYCLFTTGLVVVVTAIILASTNLPKEIETRVIYTIVTKPATRLEIIVGKVLGFAKVSAAILLIMGVFTFAYLHLRAWNLRRDVQARLNTGDVDPVSRPTLEYYAKAGLLNTRSLLEPESLFIYSRAPDPQDPRRWMFGGTGDEDFILPFDITAEDLIPPGAPDGTPPGAAGVWIRLNVGYQATPDAIRRARDAIPETIAAPGTSTLPRAAVINVSILDDELTTLVGEQVNQGQPVVLDDPTGSKPKAIPIPPEAAVNLLKPGANVTRIYLQVTGVSEGLEYFVTTDPVKSPASLIVPGVENQRRVIQPPPDPTFPDRVAQPIFRGRIGAYGQQLRGGEPGQAPVAIFHFEADSNDPRIRPVNNIIPFELRVGIERSGESEDDALTRIELTVLNRTTGKTSEPITIYPESTRSNFFNLPADAIGDGNFDAHVRNRTPGNHIGMLSTSLAAIASEERFDWNLIKSLLIIWLLSLLVVIVAIFCSTFLSWPIAIVLTLVILLGHWMVLQLGEDAGPGIGARIATDLGFQDPNVANTMARSVEALAKLMKTVANVLPDISKFASVEDIERGMSIPMHRLTDPLIVLATFGLPMLVLAYVILRNKEVAP